jgi:mersacidin/lichenicidin family type 2 lantibiotic
LGWTDDSYRSNLTDEQQKQLGENPAGRIELAKDARADRGEATIFIDGFEPVTFSIWSVLTNCSNISAAMSSTSTCCCFSIPEDPS